MRTFEALAALAGTSTVMTRPPVPVGGGRALGWLHALLSKEVWQIRGSAADLLGAIAAELARAGCDRAEYLPAADGPRWDGEEWVEGDAAVT
ncbi:MAG: hypothetical protein M0Z95_13730 [Actinomycetota bacterium]|jgi:hypothetical protein|nr:hypothetical protein [Actinomycetota bacterium]